LTEITDKPNYYAILTADVRYSKNLSPSEKLIYAEITALINQDGYCWATNEYFLKLYDVTDVSLSRWIKSLERNGFLRLEYDRNGAYITQRRIYPLTKMLMAINKNDNGAINKNVKENNEKKINTPVSEISILKVERMWHQEIETYSTYANLHPELKTAVKFYLDDQEEKEKRGITTAMVKQTLLKVQAHLGKFDYKKVSICLYDAVQKSNKDFNPAWNKTESTNQNTENGKTTTDWVMGKSKIQTGKV